MSHLSRDRLIGGQPYALETAAPPRPSIARRIALTLGMWRERIELRRHLAELDSRALRDMGVSPAAAAYESGKPFWKAVGFLR